MTDPTTDPALESWAAVDPGSDFPIQNLPFGVFSGPDTPRRVGVALGEHIVDMAILQALGAFEEANLPDGVFSRSTLNDYLSLGEQAWASVRRALSNLLSGPEPPSTTDPANFLVPTATARLHLPVAVGDYVDFYSSIQHATNVGRMFRPDDPPLLPNWRRLPIGYHGRTASIVVSGGKIIRPAGQRKPPDGDPVFGPTRRLDIELEVGFVTGPGTQLGDRIHVEDAERHIFGLVLINDWSARDIQAWEYRPLGPFLGKSFATMMSPWVVPLAALAPHRTPAPSQDPAPLPYLRTEPNLGIDLNLTVDLNGSTVSRTNFKHMYWTMAQQLAHATSNGANVRPGDLFASGTVSGEDPASFGSLLELSWNGTRLVHLADGSTRTFLEDGDEVVLRGWSGGGDAPRIGFGSCAGIIVPALS